MDRGAIEVKKVLYDHIPPTDGYDEEISQVEVGVDGVLKLIYHEPFGEGDRHYCDIYNDSGEITRVFRIDTIIFFPNKN